MYVLQEMKAHLQPDRLGQTTEASIQPRELDLYSYPIDRFGKLVNRFLGTAEFREGRGKELGLSRFRSSGFHRGLCEKFCKAWEENLRIPLKFFHSVLCSKSCLYRAKPLY